MADLQKRLHFGLLPTAFVAEPGLYKANEAGNVNTIIRSIHVTNSQNASATFTLSLMAAATGDGLEKRLFTQATIGPLGGFDWAGFIVMNPNEWLGGIASLANYLTICISGIVIT